MHSHALYLILLFILLLTRKKIHLKNKLCCIFFITESNMAETEETAPSCDIVSHHVIPTERVGALSVWVQGM